MKIGDICSRRVLLVKREDPLAEAARLMLKRHVGALVVTESAEMAARPVGLLTDRDIICGQYTHRADLYCLTVADVMSAELLTVTDDTDLGEALAKLRAGGVRRAPVVNEVGELVGIVTLDDLLPAIASQLSTLAGLMGTQTRRERVGG